MSNNDQEIGYILPNFPQTAQKALDLLNDPDCTVDDLVRLVDSDPVYAGYLLKVANSPLLRGQNQITATRQAVMRLGKAIVCNVLFSIAVRQVTPPTLEAIQVWKEAIMTGAWAMAICRKRGLSAEDGFSAGLLSGIGAVTLIINGDTRPIDAEQLTVDILQQWSLPQVVIDSARLHRNLTGVAVIGDIGTIPQAVAVAAVLAGRLRQEEQDDWQDAWLDCVDEVNDILNAFFD